MHYITTHEVTLARALHHKRIADYRAEYLEVDMDTIAAVHYKIVVSAGAARKNAFILRNAGFRY